MNTFILAQIFGLLGALSMILSNWQKTRNKILSLLIFDSIFYSLQYLLLEAYSGAFTNIVGILRIIIFKNKDKYQILQNNYFLFSIIIVYTLIGILTYNGLTSIFPVIASILYSVVLWQDDVRKIRLGTTVMIISWLIYNIVVGAYLSAVIEAILLISSITAIIKLDLLKNKNILANKLTNI